MPIVKHKVPSAEKLNAKEEFEALNANIEKLSDALDGLVASVAEMAKRNKIQDERQAFLGVKVGKMEETLASIGSHHEPRPKKITMEVTGRNEITGQIDQVELHID
jgi:hypothetical protein